MNAETTMPKKKSAVIYLCGLPTIDKPEAVKTFYFTDEQELIAELKKLQDGYVDDGDEEDKIEIVNSEQEVRGKKRKMIIAQSDCDYSYQSIIGLKFKDK